MKYRKNLLPEKLLLVLLLTLAVSACSTIEVHSKKDSQFDFSSLEYFSWSGAGPDIDPGVGSGVSAADDALRRQITENFEKRGYKFVRREEADFLLSYQIVIDRRMDERVLDAGVNTGPGWGGQNIDEATYNKKAHATYMMEYTEGSLIIQARQVGTDMLLWRGVAQGELHKEYSEAQKAERMRKAVASVVRRFPPR